MKECGTIQTRVTRVMSDSLPVMKLPYHTTYTGNNVKLYKFTVWSELLGNTIFMAPLDAHLTIFIREQGAYDKGWWLPLCHRRPGSAQDVFQERWGGVRPLAL